MNLKPAHLQVLAYFLTYSREYGLPPRRQDVAAGLALPKSSVIYYMRQLEEMGYLASVPGRPSSLVPTTRLVDLVRLVSEEDWGRLRVGLSAHEVQSGNARGAAQVDISRALAALHDGLLEERR